MTDISLADASVSGLVAWYSLIHVPDEDMPSVFSTDSARGPETTGNNRHVPDNADTRWGDPTPESGGPPPGYTIGISAGQATERPAP
jgi:hypothetical protein